MNIWEKLGILPTEDIAKIKSAYARQAKLCHPEEHPEEFKALQNAYKIAVKLAKSSKAGITVTYLPSGQAVETPGDLPPKEQDADTAPAETEERAEPDVPESVFDFSGVDAYGDREHFLNQFLLLAKNPYLKNRLDTWDYFLQQNGFADLFSHTDFRKEVVNAICGVSGWRRKTILYLEKFLTSFHIQENRPEDGQWETECRAFCLKKRWRPRLPAFCTDRFFLKEGRTFHKWLKRSVSKMAGREIDLDVQLDLVRYIRFYLSYGEAEEAYIDRLYRLWKRERASCSAMILAVCFFVTAAGIGFVQSEQDARVQEEYLMELYGPGAGALPEKEQKALRRDYNSYWKRGEKAIDDMLRRYENWE